MIVKQRPLPEEDPEIIPTSEKLVINRSFVRLLNQYYSGFNAEAYWMNNPPLKAQDFSREINEQITQAAERERAPHRPVLGEKPKTLDPVKWAQLTPAKVTQLLNGEASPTEPQLAAMHLVFKIYGDERETFVEAGQQAIKDEQGHRHAVWLTTPEGINATKAAEKAAQTKRLREEEAARVEAERATTLAQEQFEAAQATALAEKLETDRVRNQQRRREQAETKRIQAERSKERDKERADAAAKRKADELQETKNNEPLLQTDAALAAARVRIAENSAVWRKTNPWAQLKEKSFQEMLEASYSRGENFRQFMFGHMLPTWDDMSQLKFCAHLEKRNKKKDDEGKDTITDTILSSWRSGKTKPLLGSLDVICRAFDIAPEEGELMALHEKMLWKGIDGHAFKWGSKHGIVGIEAAIDETRKTGDTGKLIKELFNSSGIRFERLQDNLGVQQLASWMKGSKIENLGMAINFLNLTNPQGTEQTTQKMSRQNRTLLSLISGRELDMERMLDENAKLGNPGGGLFAALVGRNGVAKLTTEEIVSAFQTEKLEMSDDRVKKMRTSTQLQRGGKISEPYGKAILKMVKENTKELARRGVFTPITKEQAERCLEMFTGVERPKKLLQKAIEGELPIGQMLEKTLERRDQSQLGIGSFCEEAGISHISGFIQGNSFLEPETAQKIADWFARNYDFTDAELMQFIALARGVDLQRTPDEILDDVMDGTLKRTLGLRQIYDYTGVPRHVLSERASADHHTVQYSVTEVSGARLVADANTIRRIGTAAGISEDRLDDFIATFDGNKVTAKLAHAAIAARGKPAEPRKSWVDTVQPTDMPGHAKSVG